MNTFDRTSLVHGLEAVLDDSNARPYAEEALRRLKQNAAPPLRSVGTPSALAALIDHTQLRPEATEAQIRALCAEAREYGFGAVCVNPCYVPLVATLLEDVAVKVGTVSGFPLGASHSMTKAHAAKQAARDGAVEVDMVLAVGALKDGHFTAVEDDIHAVVAAAGGGMIVKVILEAGLLTDTEKALACVAVLRAGADFVKTSTGFLSGGALPADVALMRAVVGAEAGVKAAGGIRTYTEARRMVEAGATRIGASGSVALMQEALAAAGS